MIAQLSYTRSRKSTPNRAVTSQENRLLNAVITSGVSGDSSTRRGPDRRRQGRGGARRSAYLWGPRRRREDAKRRGPSRRRQRPQGARRKWADALLSVFPDAPLCQRTGILPVT